RSRCQAWPAVHPGFGGEEYLRGRSSDHGACGGRESEGPVLDPTEHRLATRRCCHTWRKTRRRRQTRRVELHIQPWESRRQLEYAIRFAWPLGRATGRCEDRQVRLGGDPRVLQVEPVQCQKRQG